MPLRPPSCLATPVVLVATVTVLMTVQPFAVKATQNQNGSYDYNILVASTCTEALKLLLSLVAYRACIDPEERSHTLLTRREVLAFALPALVYTLNNALVFLIVQSLKPSAFQLLSATKTVFTALLMRLLLKKHLNPVQRYAIVLLAMGAAVSQLSTMSAPHEHSSPSSPSSLHPLPTPTRGGGAGCGDAPGPALADLGHSQLTGEALGVGVQLVGVLLTLLSCASSSLGGVLNELLLKRDGALHSLHLQNSLLYAWGVVFNILAVLARSTNASFNMELHDSANATFNATLNTTTVTTPVYATDSIFTGFDERTLLVIVTNAATGLTISAILKLTDNLIRCIAHVFAMITSAVLESTLELALPSAELCLSIVVVGCSTLLYAGEVNRTEVARPRVGTARVVQMVDDGERT